MIADWLAWHHSSEVGQPPTSRRSGIGHICFRSASGRQRMAHSKELRSSGTSTAYGRSTAKSITSRA